MKIVATLPVRLQMHTLSARLFGPVSEATSENLRGALVVALSLCLAYGLAFWWQLEKPFWAGFSVIILAGLPTVGQSLQKALLRAGGTVIGAAVALLLTATLHQHHEWLLIGLSVYLATAGYLMTGNPNSRYFYFIAGLVCMIVVVMSLKTPLTAFSLVVNRAQETLLGIGAHTLVSLLVMQPSSRSLLLFTVGNIRTELDALAALPHTTDPQAVQSVRTDLNPLLERAALLLPAVELESPKDYMRRQIWHAFLALSRELADMRIDRFEAADSTVSADERRVQTELDTITAHLVNDGPVPNLSAPPPPPHTIPAPSERLRVPLQVLVHFWVVILVWVELNPPGLPTLNFVELSLLMGFICLFAGNISPAELFRPFLIGSAALTPLYFLVYPHLHTAEGFLLVMFVYTFGICVFFPGPKKALSREGLFLPWLAVGQFTDVPGYSADRFFTFLAVIMLSIMLVTVVHQLCFADVQKT